MNKSIFESQFEYSYWFGSEDNITAVIIKNTLIFPWNVNKKNYKTLKRTKTKKKFSPLSICGCPPANSWGQNRLLLFCTFFFLWLGELVALLLSEGALASNIGCRILRRALINQLLTCSKVKLVCAAMCRFSSSVGYGC